MDHKGCPIQSQIVSAEDTIKNLLTRITIMEKRLESPGLSAEKKYEIETELKEIKKLLTANKELLLGLRKENSKSFILTACLVFLCFLIYGLYVMIYGY